MATQAVNTKTGAEPLTAGQSCGGGCGLAAQRSGTFAEQQLILVQTMETSPSDNCGSVCIVLNHVLSLSPLTPGRSASADADRAWGEEGLKPWKCSTGVIWHPCAKTQERHRVPG